MCPRSNVGEVRDVGVMIDAGMGVEDDVIAERAAWLEDGTGEEDGAIANVRVPSDIGAGMHECRPGDGAAESFGNGGTNAV